MFAIYDAETLELIEGGFFYRDTAEEAAEGYRAQGRSVLVKRQVR